MCATPIARLDARADFERARRGYLAARVRRWLTARRPSRTRPRHLDDAAALPWRAERLRVIPLESIVGTVDATGDFDAGFKPATERVSSRWQSVARAHHEGRPLPPIAVIERPDGYYVLDGRHRVSVARALDHPDINAWARRAEPVRRARDRVAPSTAKNPGRSHAGRARPGVRVAGAALRSS
jgi:hypothetical protein